MRRLRWVMVMALAVLAALVPGITTGVQGADDVVAVDVLSNRADLVSGGDALVEVSLPAGADPATAAVDLNGADITAVFKPNGGTSLVGLVTGLAPGANTLTARLPDGRGAGLTVTNHAIGGPVFSGPQIQPWACPSSPPAQDAQCNRPPTYAYKYKSTNPTKSGFQNYDPANPPTDVATTTTENGQTVPYIVRTETGIIDRDEYRIAVLFDPAQPWPDGTSPQPAFNHKLVITHGASCDTSYAAGSAPDVMNDAALSRGFVVMSHALDNAGHNCNIVTQAEALVMTKEYVVDHYGTLRYTIGSGCSGGSLVQQQIANAFPGVYQGITPQCSYPDAWSSALQYEDYHLLLDYFKAPQSWEPGVVWGQREVEAVLGHPNPANPVTFTTVIPDSGYPDRNCPGVPADQVYDKDANRTGVRCTLADYMVNVFGRRAEDGFANVPWDNTGVQYGLRGLRNGTLTPAQFVDVNARIGGRTIDHEPSPDRVAADEFGLAAAYRSGAINEANNLDSVAIIDLRGPDPGAFHDVYRTYALRARLEREHGRADNQVLWRGSVPLLGDANYVAQSIVAMDKWLAAVEADGRDVPLAQKVREDRPAGVADRCTTGAGQDVPAAYCDAVVVSYATPRIEAGMPFTDDVTKCQLKPLRQSDYFPVRFTAEQWSRLQQAFPTGVCDYSKPGVQQQGAVAWQTYADGPGGRPLGPPPGSTPFTA